MILTVRPATQTDALWLGCNLREEDRREVETATGMAAEAVVPASLYHSRECYTMRRPDSDGRIADMPCMIFGVHEDPRESGVGVVWMLCSDAIRTAALSILREASYWLDAWAMRYPNGLHNLVDKRNILHLRWLQLMGFTFHGEHEVNGQLFIHAIRWSNNV